MVCFNSIDNNLRFYGYIYISHIADIFLEIYKEKLEHLRLADTHRTQLSIHIE